jgi:hypothetical protein
MHVYISGDGGQSQDVCRGEVGANRPPHGGQESGELGYQIQAQGLLAQGQEHLLLAASAPEIAIAHAGTGIPEGGLAVHVLPAGGHVEVGGLIVDGLLHVDVHAPHGIHDLHQARKVNGNIVVNGDTEVLVDGAFGQRWAATGVLVQIAPNVGRVDAILGGLGLGGDVDHEVARDGEHPCGLVYRIHGDDGDGVGALEPAAGGLVQAQKEEIDPPSLLPGGRQATVRGRSRLVCLRGWLRRSAGTLAWGG